MSESWDQSARMKTSSRPSVPTLSFMVGGEECQASCPCCIAKLTRGGCGNWNRCPTWYRNLSLVFKTADRFNVHTVMITGKGEPTLHMDDVRDVVSRSRGLGFITELQTNGFIFSEDKDSVDGLSADGLNTVAISRMSIDDARNRSLMGEGSPNLKDIVKSFMDKGINVRLTYVGFQGENDTTQKIIETCKKAADFGVSQVTIRKMGKIDLKNSRKTNRARDVIKFTDKNFIQDNEWMSVVNELRSSYKIGRTLDWGSVSWMIEGVECMVTDCLSLPGTSGAIRYLIYRPDGHLSYSWEYENSLIF